MSYTKNTWNDRNVQYPTRYTDELGNTKTFTPSPGTVTNAGTNITAAYMNNLEKGIEYVSNIYGASSTGNDTYVISLTNANFDTNSYVAGDRFLFKPDTSNTGACTLNINSKGAKTIKKISSSGLIDTITGDIIANGIYELVYDGTYLILMNPVDYASSVLTASGDMLYASAANVLARLAKGTDGQVLNLVSGLPSWGDKVSQGTYTGNNSSNRTISLTFTPKIVFVINQTSGSNFFIGWSTVGMAINESGPAITVQTADSDSVPKPTTNGFIVGGSDSSSLNYNSNTFNYVAIG